MKKTLALILVLTFAVALVAGCASTSATTAAPAATKAGETTAATTAAPTEPAATFKGQDIRVVIGSTSTTADTYMNTETAWRYLSKELGANYKVDPVGAGAAYEALATAKPDGSLVEEFHDMMYIGVMSGAFDPKYALENFVVGPRLSMNNGSCFAAKKDAPYNDMKEMAEYLKANPTVTLRLAVEAGSVSHVAFVAYYEWLVGAYGQDVADRIKVLALGSTSDKLQAMWDGNVDVIFADYNTMLQYTEEGVDAQLAAKIIALLADLPGVDLPTYASLGITIDGKPFSFSKDFFVFLPKGAPASLLAELDKAAEAICNNPEFQADMEKMKFTPAYLSSADAQKYLYEKRDSSKALIERSPSLDDLTAQ